jgi:hypothetical protein
MLTGPARQGERTEEIESWERLWVHLLRLTWQPRAGWGQLGESLLKSFNPCHNFCRLWLKGVLFGFRQ